MNLSITITDTQKFGLTVGSAVDGAGNPVPFAGTLSVTASDDTALLVSPGADQSSFEVAAAATAGKLGTFQVTVTDGAITDTIDVTVIASAEKGFAVTLGTPEEIAPAA